MSLTISPEFRAIEQVAATLACQCQENNNPTPDEIGFMRTSLATLEGRVTALNETQLTNSSSGAALTPDSLERVNSSFQTMRNFLAAQEFRESKTPAIDTKGKKSINERPLQVVEPKITRDLVIRHIFSYLSVKDQVAFCESHRTGITQADHYPILEIRRKHIYKILRSMQRMPYDFSSKLLDDGWFTNLLEQLAGRAPENLHEQLTKGQMLFDREKTSASSLPFLLSLISDSRLITKHPFSLTSQIEATEESEGIWDETSPKYQEYVLSRRIWDAKEWILIAREMHSRFRSFERFKLTEVAESLLVLASGGEGHLALVSVSEELSAVPFIQGFKRSASACPYLTNFIEKNKEKIVDLILISSESAVIVWALSLAIDKIARSYFQFFY